MDSLSEYFYEIESGEVNVITPEVIEFETTLKTQVRDFPSSGIWIVISRPSSTIISELREAISKKDFGRFDFLVNVGSKEFKTIEKSIKYKKNLFNSIQEIPVLIDVTCGSKILSKYLFLLPIQNYIFTFIPCYGGNLSAKDFRVSQYFNNGYIDLFNTLIIIKRPILTELEKVIFQKIPSENSQLILKVVHDAALPSDIIKLVDMKGKEEKKDNINEQFAHLDSKDTQKPFNIQKQQHQHLQSQEIILQKQMHDTDEKQNEAIPRIEGGGTVEHFDNLTRLEYIEELDVHSSAIKLLKLREKLVRSNLIQ